IGDSGPPMIQQIRHPAVVGTHTIAPQHAVPTVMDNVMPPPQPQVQVLGPQGMAVVGHPQGMAGGTPTGHAAPQG
ncbi:hypothetical protein KIPB_012505, partial [Kipferlia bialata]